MNNNYKVALILNSQTHDLNIGIADMPSINVAISLIRTGGGGWGRRDI